MGHLRLVHSSPSVPARPPSHEEALAREGERPRESLERLEAAPAASDPAKDPWVAALSAGQSVPLPSHRLRGRVLARARAALALEATFAPVVPVRRRRAAVQIGAAVCLAFVLGAGGAFLRDDSARRSAAKPADLVTADRTPDQDPRGAASSRHTAALRAPAGWVETLEVGGRRDRHRPGLPREGERIRPSGLAGACSSGLACCARGRGRAHGPLADSAALPGSDARALARGRRAFALTRYRIADM